MIQGVVNAFVIGLSRVVGWAVDRLVFRTEEGHGPAFLVTALVAQVVFGLLASPIVFWFSRQREFRADAGGARLAGTAPMIAALERLARVRDPHPLPEGMAALGIQAPGAFARWFRRTRRSRSASRRCAWARRAEGFPYAGTAQGGGRCRRYCSRTHAAPG